MNTKQLWCALIKNSVTENKFDGIFSSDLLDDIVSKPKLIICNTDPSHKKGSHWVLFFFENENLEFYDSLGKSINDYGKEFVNFAKRYSVSYEECKYRTQPKDTDICGQLCLYFAYYKCKGYNMDFIMNKMSDIDLVLKLVNSKFNICKMSKCMFLQCCNKF